MRLSRFIAWRYLFAKKSHNVINIISIISAAGIAIGCAALVIILSIYNGFDSIVRDLNDSHTADVLVTPATGKVFNPDARFDFLKDDPRVRAACGVLEESVFVQYGDRNKVVVAKGVDSLYERVTGLREHLTEGEFSLGFGDLDQVVLGRTIALELGARPAFLQPLVAWFPSRTAQVDLLNPLSSLRQVKLHPAGIVSLEQNFDQKYMFLPLDALQELLEYDGEVSGVEIYLTEAGLDRHRLASRELLTQLRATLGDGFTVRDRQQQNTTLYKLLKYEKIAIYLILLFVMLIISFNIYGSLSMLIIEKRDDIATFRSMGADDSLIGQIFVREGWLISLLGIAVGIVLGLLVCWAQQRFGLVKMPGNFVVDAYPVVVRVADILIVIAGVALIGWLISLGTRRITR
ncbi:MAG: ABC transporter permease [Bacteroidales bacterium]|nr:ABC transporter permease [Bacteroidales bacterium]MBQ9397073.1 ABC transporter permease [Bacteroidales bacterium]